MPLQQPDSPVVLFDGVCNLCNQSVLFIIKRDPGDTFRFAALQSGFGMRVLEQHQLDVSGLYSIILVEGDKITDRSTAALRIARRLNGLWPLLYALIVIPPFIRNWVYDWISRNRYKWFGKKDECMIPTPDLKARFVT
jgi:predicted DCC family thiol-disulfide oxidoreductase YuxK